MSARDAVRTAVDACCVQLQRTYACCVQLQRTGTHVTTAVRLAVESACLRVRRETLATAGQRLMLDSGTSDHAMRAAMPALLPDGAPTPIESPRAALERDGLDRHDTGAPTVPGRRRRP